MSCLEPGQRIGISDPDDWIGWWLGLHPSALFAGEFTRLARTLPEDLATVDGIGSQTIRFTEQAKHFEAEVKYAIQTLATGRVLHVLSIRSEGDPTPPIVGDQS